jgi:hypothetical protein
MMHMSIYALVVLRLTTEASVVVYDARGYLLDSLS